MMTMVFKRKWEAAHRLIEGVNKNTLCSQPHGHTWNVEVEIVERETRALDGGANVIAPFSEVKGLWHQWIDQHVDHGFFFNVRDPMLKFILEHNPEGRHVVLPGDPTTEVIAATFFLKLSAFLAKTQPQLKLKKLTIHETQTNSISLEGNAEQFLPAGAQGSGTQSRWWARADFSTHDLSHRP
ncbi:MAG: 6-carboxytetrahydropterin synthase [Bdellovibrionales bacterium]|nr:6-carboxytetrahydropterin synthase [Bdellovibrionales bacterium]